MSMGSVVVVMVLVVVVGMATEVPLSHKVLPRPGAVEQTGC